MSSAEVMVISALRILSLSIKVMVLPLSDMLSVTTFPPIFQTQELPSGIFAEAKEYTAFPSWKFRVSLMSLVLTVCANAFCTLTVSNNIDMINIILVLNVERLVIVI